MPDRQSDEEGAVGGEGREEKERKGGEGRGGGGETDAR